MFLPSCLDECAIVALVATHHRANLLITRAIPSILAQSRPPDRLIVVVDGSEEEMLDLREQLHRICDGRQQVTVLRNVRTPQRAAGAWNTAIDHLHRDAALLAAPQRCYVAILDDDDMWAPEHLHVCSKATLNEDLVMVAAGLIRHEQRDDVGRQQSIPEAIVPREQFIRGQHIQGSNLFVRLDALLKVGGFDEHLPSCTDRDLCIRLCRLAGFTFRCVPHHTVHHHADPRPDRLSTPSSVVKREGLDRFWRKHALCFDEAARQAAATRARDLFGWTPPTDALVIHAVPGCVAPAESVRLVAGFATDARCPGHVTGLLSDLLELSRRSDVGELRVVVLENGPLPDRGDRPLHKCIAQFAERGLCVDLVSLERLHRDWQDEVIVDVPDPRTQRLPIAVTRTLLATYVGRLAAAEPGRWAWILDDDKRLRISVDRGDGTLVERVTPDLNALRALQQRGVDVVLGPDTGAAPLPFTACLRTQLVDLEYNLRLILHNPPNAPWPDQTTENAVNRHALVDSYYDLARTTEHLETPFWMRCEEEQESCAAVLGRIGKRMGRLRAGEQVFRPLVVDAKALPVESAHPSIYRGGSAVYFQPSALLAIPNNVARIGDRYVRRSDMLVTALMRTQMGLTVVAHPAIAVRHDRSDATANTSLNGVLRDDIEGYALARANDELLRERQPITTGQGLVAWRDAELRLGVHLAQKYMNERLAAFTLSAFRVVGLAEAIKMMVDQALVAGGSWASPVHAEPLRAISNEMTMILTMFNIPNAMAFAETLQNSFRKDDVSGAFRSMDGLIHAYRASHRRVGVQNKAFEDERERRARSLLHDVFGVEQLRTLGAGGEGIVFTDGAMVYKVLDLLKTRPKHDTIGLLKSLAGKLDGTQHLCRINHVDEHDGVLVLTYPYEPSQPYHGGHGPELIALLRECKQAGITCRNMHPKNLLVCDSGLKLIDYGSDIRPFSDAGFRSMAERTWLTWRWHHRPDLTQIMRRALTDKSLPELDGFERFWSALNDENPSAIQVAAAMVEQPILQAGARNVIDYGCGKHALLARTLAAVGVGVTGYDPGPTMVQRWGLLGDLPARLELLTSRERLLRKGPFDVVVCSLVLCELPDGAEYERVLADLRHLVSDNGVVYVTVCHPCFTFGGPTAIHRQRITPTGATYNDAFPYREVVGSGATRTEYHRSMTRLESDLLRHGLRVQGRLESAAVDLERFEPASDFLTLICRPLPDHRRTPRLSLVIKTCAMEWQTLERQVEHLVRQLTGPRSFHERLLVLDSRRDGFVRAYTEPDWERARAAADRLARHGLVDRVILAAAEPCAVSALNQRWFGLASTATHSVQGAPLAAPLQAFEACQGEYILQVDSDVMVARRDVDHDFLGDMIQSLEADPDAVTVAFNIAHSADRPYTACRDLDPWRVECRACLLHRERLLRQRPIPNTLENSAPRLSWHRSMDLGAKDGRFKSFRGGDNRTFFIHPPNEVKKQREDWLLLLSLIEAGRFAPMQCDKVDLAGSVGDWLPRERKEPYVFVLTGRNVPPGRWRRCLDSLLSQTRRDWGAVVIDDGSDQLCRDYIRLSLAPWSNQVTLLQPPERRGQMANLIKAIRHICVDPESVMITLDMDDALLGPEVLGRVAAEFEAGADVTVGSMLRTDKHKEYPVEFSNPRAHRGGNIWQHLRAFRKRLFDAIPDDALRIDGQYVDIAVDWAFMLPIVEAATRPVWIREPLYLYESSGLGKRDDRDARERQIAAIVAKGPCKMKGAP